MDPLAPVPPGRADLASRFIEWTPVFAGALAATALSSVLLSFAAAAGLSVASSSPSWRDASIALWLLSGVYLILQALVSFGLGGYVAGRIRSPGIAGTVEEVETRDGVHGLIAWALAVVFGALLLAFIGGNAVPQSSSSSNSTTSSTAEPLLGYELDRLFRAPRRSPSVDMRNERAEAGRILLTTAGHAGLATDDRAYLVQQVAALTGLPPADAERRVDGAIARSKAAISRSRASGLILAFSLATSLLLGAIVAWAAAGIGGRHRDGAPVPEWMSRSNRLHRLRPLG